MVLFVDEHGKEFFECHSAEARAAIEFIKDLRQDPNIVPPPPHLKKVATKGLKALNKTPIKISPKGSNISRLADSFAEIEKHEIRTAFIICSAQTYGSIRKFDRNLVYIETRASVLNLGIMGSLWGAHIILTNNAPVGGFFCASEDLKYTTYVEEQDEQGLGVKQAIVNIIDDLRKLCESLV